ncbi:FAR1-related sequence 5-like protein [Tanacetum coccineum]|uniref:FAR1-related sequence 5-like protein n=1 Tax=Tanacetum coccineum TaxID=301880 RepID=A0ABQ5IS02_9ASTR
MQKVEVFFFFLRLTVRHDYPYMPPKMRFTTKVWHPNISSQTGDICRDLLKNNWSPAITLRSALICLQVLLLVPEPKHPQDAFVAKQYLTDHAAFTATAWHWTKDFAMVSSAEYNRKSLLRCILRVSFSGTDRLKSKPPSRYVVIIYMFCFLNNSVAARKISLLCTPFGLGWGDRNKHNIICIALQPVTTYLNSTINDSSTRPLGSSESDIRINSYAHSFAPSCMYASYSVNTRRPLQTLPILHPYSDESSGYVPLFPFPSYLKLTLVKDIDENQLPEVYEGNLQLAPIQDETNETPTHDVLEIGNVDVIIESDEHDQIISEFIHSSRDEDSESDNECRRPTPNGHKYWFPDVPVEEKPTEGDVFDNFDEAYNMYLEYAEKARFSIRKSTTKRKKGLRDAQMMVDKMNDRKKHVPNLSFEYKTVNDELSRMFWADETLKCNYIAFGDVVSFDATYRTNRYRMIFFLFTGIDHHQKCVTFGAGLLSDETFESYTGILTAFF